MSPGRLLTILALLWLVGLGMALQPHRHTPPRIVHAQLLERPVRDLPTLAPRAP